MKMTKKFLSVFLSVLMVAMMCVSFGSLAFAEEATVVASGECGDQGGNLTWTFTSDGVLTISGTGAMASYSDYTELPWSVDQLFDEDAIMLQVLADMGYQFESMEDLEAYAAAHPDEFDEALEMEAMRRFYGVYYNQPTIKSLVIEEGVTAISEDAFSMRLDSVSLPASLSVIPENAIRLNGTLTVNGKDTDISNIALYVCQDGYAFKTRTEKENYETVLNKYLATAQTLSTYMGYEVTQEDLDAFMAEHEGMTEEEARAQMLRNIEANTLLLAATFGVPGNNPAEILHNAFLGIDTILGTSYADDTSLAADWNNANCMAWYQNDFYPTLQTVFFGSVNPTNINVQDGNLKLSEVGGSYYAVPWITVEARCDSLARQQIEDKGVKFVSLGGHDLENHAAKAPTCVDIGWDAYQTCTKCDYTTYTEKAATGVHTYGEWVETTPATATEDGVKTRECSVCHQKDTDVIPATGTPDTPDEPTTPATPDEPSDGGNSGFSFSSLWAKIVAFFQKIINFFKNLFTK